MAVRTALKGKRLADLFFTRESPGSKTWLCKCGVKRVQNGSGYTNLCSHIFIDHESQLNSLKTLPDKPIEECFWPKRVKYIHDWLEIEMMMLLPFSFFENPFARRHLKSDSMSKNTFMKYLGSVTQVVERQIRILLPDTFALVFDGWTCGSTHYLAIFASYSTAASPEAEKVLLSFSPMGIEESLNAHEHVNFT